MTSILCFFLLLSPGNGQSFSVGGQVIVGNGQNGQTRELSTGTKIKTKIHGPHPGPAGSPGSGGTGGTESAEGSGSSEESGDAADRGESPGSEDPGQSSDEMLSSALLAAKNREFSKADSLFREALEIMDATGASSEDQVAAYDQMASAYENIGQSARATSVLTQLWDRWRAGAPVRSPTLDESMVHLSDLFEEDNDSVAALAVRLDSGRISLERGESPPPEIWESTAALIEKVLDSGIPTGLDDVFQSLEQMHPGDLRARLERRLEETESGDHKALIFLERLMARQLANAGDTVGAVPHLETALASMETLTNPASLETARLALELGQTLRNLGRDEAAHPYIHRALRIFRDQNARSDLIPALGEMIDLLKDMGHTEQADRLETKLRALQQKGRRRNKQTRKLE